MKALFEAIEARFQSGQGVALRALLGDKFFQYRAPQGTKVPYGLFSLVTAVPYYNFSSSFERCRIQFDYYHNLVAGVDDLCEAHKELFDDAPLAVAGFELIGFERIMARKIDQEHAFRWVMEHIAELQKE